MTKTQARRDRGLCIWCEAPALPDTTRPSAANRALSEGRMVPSARISEIFAHAWDAVCAAVDPGMVRTLRGEALREYSGSETLHTMRTEAPGAV